MIPALLVAAAATAATKSAACDPDLWLYRDRTVGLLKRYLRYSIEVGRLPSLLGREFFRTRVTSYYAGTFEDAVIFVHDVERALEKLDGFEKKLIARIVLQINFRKACPISPRGFAILDLEGKKFLKSSPGRASNQRARCFWAGQFQARG